jgi:hypothetical protein
MCQHLPPNLLSVKILSRIATASASSFAESNNIMEHYSSTAHAYSAAGI